MGVSHYSACECAAKYPRSQQIYNRTVRLKKSPELTLDGEGTLDVSYSCGLIHVGCVSIEPDARKALVKQVEQLLQCH